MKTKALFCVALSFILMALIVHGFAGSEQVKVQYPKGADQSAQFFMTAEGVLAYTTGNRGYLWDDSRWKNGQPKAPSTYTLEQEATTISVMKDGKLFFQSSDYDTLAPVSDQLCFATRNATLFSVDMVSGSAKALCNIGDLSAGDHFDQLAASVDDVYAIQKDAKWIFRIDAAWALNNTDRMLTLVDATAGIGNVVLNSAGQLLSQHQPGMALGIVKKTPDQLRLSLLSGNKGIDLMAVSPSLLRQLAQAGRLVDLSQHQNLLTIWDKEWYDLSSLCKVDGRLVGLPLWDNVLLLEVSGEVMQRLGISLPEGGWTYDDFLRLAREVRRDADGDGKPGTFVCYAKYQYGDEESNQVVAFTPLVHQVFALCQDGEIPFTDERILHAMEIWKTCLDEGLINRETGSHEHADYQHVLLPMTTPLSWPMAKDYLDERLCFPAIAPHLASSPSQTLFLCANSSGEKAEAALQTIAAYMTTGADEHGYLRGHRYQREHFVNTRMAGYLEPTPLRAAHYQAALEGARRDEWDHQLYAFMEEAFARFLAGEITALECTRSWEDKALMMRME